jgi:hypothetical protein
MKTAALLARQRACRANTLLRHMDAHSLRVLTEVHSFITGHLLD